MRSKPLPLVMQALLLFLKDKLIYAPQIEVDEMFTGASHFQNGRVIVVTYAGTSIIIGLASDNQTDIKLYWTHVGYITDRISVNDPAFQDKLLATIIERFQYRHDTLDASYL